MPLIILKILRRNTDSKERETEIRTFDNIIAAKVVAKNQKLFINREEGFSWYCNEER